uniref:Uncharacterized protein n=1 Tax=Timema genevievae TaxID=629358 RepID=A0A7R9JPS8_TIMGE|nr:unnamed protein product [Timema genevievae]
MATLINSCESQNQGATISGPVYSGDKSSTVVIVALLEGAVFAQHVQGLQLLHHKLPVGEKEFYLFRLLHISVLGERPFETGAEIIVTLRVLPAQVQQLEAQSVSILTGSGLV